MKRKKKIYYHCQAPTSPPPPYKITWIIPKTAMFSFQINCYVHIFMNRPSGPILSISRNVRISVCPSHFFLTPFNSLLAPPPQSQMSKLFRYFESLGKSNGKKWSQIWKLFVKHGVKSPRQKNMDFFFYICSLRLNVFLPQLL